MAERIPIPTALRDAADLIVVNGHYQGRDLIDRNQFATGTLMHRCRTSVRGAIFTALAGSPEHGLLHHLVHVGDGPIACRAVAFTLGIEPDELDAWNNEPGRSTREVIDALHRAADRLDTIPTTPR
jgi:hypothetical protein